MTSDSSQTMHTIGVIDAMAFFLTTVRLSGSEQAIVEIAEQMLRINPNHPHAKWVLEHKDEWIGGSP